MFSTSSCSSLPFGVSSTFGMSAKPPIAHDDAKGVEPDFALADVFVAIDA